MSEGLLAGKRIVISGSTRGLGRAFAIAVTAHGAHVVVNGTNREALNETVGAIEQIGGIATAVHGSVADDGVAEQLVATCVDQFGGIDVAITNAAITRDRTLLKSTPEEFDETIAVNLRGTWSVCRHAAQGMKETGGLLLMVGSGAAVTPSVGQSSYAASKAGVLGLMYSWSGELARYGIRVNVFGPTAVTDMTAERLRLIDARSRAAGQEPPSPESLGFGRPDHVAAAIVHLCSDRAAHVTSQFIRFNGRRLALWRHPAESLLIDRDQWSVDDIAAHFPARLEPVCALNP